VDMKGRRGVDSQVVVDGVEVEAGVGSVVEVGVDLAVEDVEVVGEKDSVDVVVIAEVVGTDIRSSHSTFLVPIPIVKIRKHQ